MESDIKVLLRSRVSFRWIAAQHKKLVPKYNRQWIAVLNRKVIDHGRDIGKLDSRLRQRYSKDYQYIVTEYITRYTADNMILVA